MCEYFTGGDGGRAVFKVTISEENSLKMVGWPSMVEIGVDRAYELLSEPEFDSGLEYLA